MSKNVWPRFNANNDTSSGLRSLRKSDTFGHLKRSPSGTHHYERKTQLNFDSQSYVNVTYNETEISKILAVWPVYSRTRVPLLASINRIIPSKPAENNRWGCLGCQTSLTTPAVWLKDCLSIWDGMSQKLILPLSVPVTTRLIVVSGQNETASTELSSSELPTPWQDKVHKSYKKSPLIKTIWHTAGEKKYWNYFASLCVVKFGCGIKWPRDNQVVVAVTINRRDSIGMSLSSIHVLKNSKRFQIKNFHWTVNISNCYPPTWKTRFVFKMLKQNIKT